MARILIVEDERSLRLLYQRELEHEGHEVLTAANAAEGLKIVESENPDLVVLDIRMPGMDGLDAMSRILEKRPRLPVILNSAYASYKDNFMSWAADAYVIKSGDTTELRATIRDVLQARASGPAPETAR
jgi:DNA-binding response OmpR family regulator